MKGWLLLGVAAIAAAGWKLPSRETVVIIGGDMKGYLTPCGCTKPMMGGLRRRITMTQALIRGTESLVLEQGSLSDGRGRQAELKIEAASEILSPVNAVIGWHSEDAALGKGAALSAGRLSGNRVVCGSVVVDGLGIPEHVVHGQFVVGSASTKSAQMALSLGGSSVSAQAAALQLVAAAESEQKTPVLLLDGSREEAEGLAKDVPGLRLVVYRHKAEPPAEPIRVGDTLLVTPGEKGKQVLRLTFAEGKFDHYSVVQLGPDVADHEATCQKLHTYLNRVGEEDLLGKLPRTEGPAFAGSESCAPCHNSAYESWRESKHALALQTLRAENHDKDPDCVGCHVIGLDSTKGFVSAKATPDLGSVGCESCHGPRASHVRNPKAEEHDPKKACVTCHTTDNSPNFDYDKYWPLIRHK